MQKIPIFVNILAGREGENEAKRNEAKGLDINTYQADMGIYIKISLQPRNARKSGQKKEK